MNLKWQPTYNVGQSLADELKYFLRRAEKNNKNFTHCDIPYLEGLRDAGIKDADTLIEAIEKYDYITVYEE